MAAGCPSRGGTEGSNNLSNSLKATRPYLPIVKLVNIMYCLLIWMDVLDPTFNASNVSLVGGSSILDEPHISEGQKYIFKIPQLLAVRPD